MSIWLPLRTRSLISPILRTSNYNSLVSTTATGALRRNAHILVRSSRTKPQVPGHLITSRHASTSSPSNEPKSTASSAEPKSTDVATSENLSSSSVPSKATEPQQPFMTRAWAKIKHEANHYWDGTKLLGKETKISWRLLRRLLRGKQLTRRERRQVCSFDIISLSTMSLYLLTICCLASTHHSGFTSSCAILCIHRRTVYGTAPTSGNKTLPEHAAVYLRG